ncbi:MAG: amidohydrolase [Lachnotalea sp.]
MNEKMDIFQDGYLIIEGTKIIEIGNSYIELKEHIGKEDNYIDALSGILMPGMINTHCHVSMMPFRSLGDDCKNRLQTFVFPLEIEAMNQELVYQGARYGICELLLSGITTFFDMYYFEDEVAKACAEQGIRAILGETVIDMETCESANKNSGYEYAIKFMKDWSENDLITPTIAPHATHTVKPYMIKKAHDLAVKHNVMFSMHVYEMDDEMALFAQKYEKTPVEFLEDIGVLDQHALLVHAIHTTDHDIRIMKEHGVSVAHCIVANTKSGKGIAPIYSMLSSGIQVGIGTDSAMSGNSLDLFTQMRMIATSQKTKYHDRSILTAAEIVKMATIGGAKALHMESKIGSLEVGKVADITLVETQSVNMFPNFNPYSTLVYAANAGNVDTVIVNGQILVHGKKLVNTTLEKEKQALENLMLPFYQKAYHFREFT